MKRRRVKRRYDGTQRKEAAARTRALILEQARRVFVARGYAGTTMADIASAAEIALDTVYASVGTKSVLFRTLLETAISGTDQAVPAESRDYVRAIHDERNARGKLALYARALGPIHARLAPLVRVVKEAASTDAELARVWKTIATRRAANMRRFAIELAATGQLRPDVSIDDVADIIWAMNAPEFYLLVVTERRWSQEKFEVWLASAWERLLLA